MEFSDITNIFLVLITAFYAYLTYKMTKTAQETLEEMREHRWEAMMPQILIEPYVRKNTPILYLKISNIGKNSAKKISFSIDKEFWQFGERKEHFALHNKDLFKKQFGTFHPNQELHFALAQGFILFAKEENPLCPLQFTISVKYEYLGKQLYEEFYIDLKIYVGSEQEREPLVDEIKVFHKNLVSAIKHK